ncbi:hypothetical protein BSAF29S_06073 [Bacillus safensis subsp. safensis]
MGKTVIVLLLFEHLHHKEKGMPSSIVQVKDEIWKTHKFSSQAIANLNHDGQKCNDQPVQRTLAFQPYIHPQTVHLTLHLLIILLLFDQPNESLDQGQSHSKRCAKPANKRSAGWKYWHDS